MSWKQNYNAKQYTIKFHSFQFSLLNFIFPLLAGILFFQKPQVSIHFFKFYFIFLFKLTLMYFQFSHFISRLIPFNLIVTICIFHFLKTHCFNRFNVADWIEGLDWKCVKVKNEKKKKFKYWTKNLSKLEPIIYNFFMNIKWFFFNFIIWLIFKSKVYIELGCSWCSAVWFWIIFNTALCCAI